MHALEADCTHCPCMQGRTQSCSTKILQTCSVHRPLARLHAPHLYKRRKQHLLPRSLLPFLQPLTAPQQGNCHSCHHVVQRQPQALTCSMCAGMGGPCPITSQIMMQRDSHSSANQQKPPQSTTCRHKCDTRNCPQSVGCSKPCQVLHCQVSAATEHPTQLPVHVLVGHL